MIKQFMTKLCMQLVTICLTIALFGCGSDKPKSNGDDGPAPTPASKEDLNGIRACYAAYEKAVETADGKAAIACVDSNTFQLYDRLRKLALMADADTVRALSAFEKLIVLRMRHEIPLETLQAMTGETMFAHGVTQEWTDKNSVKQNDLGEIEVKEDVATGVHVFRGQPTEFRAQFRKENGEWKFEIAALMDTVGKLAFEQLIQQSGQPEDQYLVYLLELVSEKPADESIWQPLVK